MNILKQRKKIRFKSLLSMFLALVMILMSVPYTSLTAVAYEAGMEIENGYPLKVTFETEKDSYSSLSTARYDITIENTSNKTVENISAKCGLDSIQPIDSNSILEIDGVNLKAGESYSFTFYATVKSSKLNFFLAFFLLLKNLFASGPINPDSDFNDGRPYMTATTDVKYGSVAVNEEVTVWYDYDSDVVEAETEDDFDAEIMSLVRQTMSSKDFDIEEAKSNSLYAKRIIVKLKNNSVIDFSVFCPDTIIYGEDNVVVLQFATEELTEYCYNSLNNNNSVIYIEFDEIVSTNSLDINTFAMSSRVGVSNMSWGENFTSADDYSKYLSNNEYHDLVTVAVVDTGIDMDHPYLEGRILSSGKDYIDEDGNPEDENGHGTHVAGIIVDCTNDLNVKIMPVRVLDANGYNYKSSVSRGIHYAINNGADVINLSLGGTESRYIDEAIGKAIEEDIVVCVAAGNGDPAKGNQAIDTATVCPAHIEDVIVVGALQQNGNIAYFSNYGDSVDVVAPGVSIQSAYLNGDYAVMSGTSMATPHVSAIAAMIRLRYPSYSCGEIESFIKNYCKDMGDQGKDKYYGFGAIDLYNAIPDCTIQYETNKGVNIDDITVKDGDEVRVPTLTKNYTVTFVSDGTTISKKYPESVVEGWYEKADYTGKSYAPNSVYVAKNDIVLYAKWKNSKLELPSEPKKTYYTFDGWFDAKSGGKKYTATSEITSDITLYARWREDLVSIPNVIGQSYTNAKATLEGLGFNVVVASDYNDNVSYTLVYAQSATGQLRRGSTITITYSLGRRAFYIGECVTFAGGTIKQNVDGSGRTVQAGPSDVYITDLSYWYNGVEYVGIKYVPTGARYGWVPISTIYHK